MKREEKPWVNGKSKLVEFSTIMRCLLSTLTLLAIALPVNAQNWMMVPVLFADGSQLYIDSASVKRSWKKVEQISFRVQVQGFGNTAQGRVSGNCNTGTWRLSSGKSSGSGLVLPESAGNEVLRSACLMPYTLTKPR